jgi:hypothetical protein
MTKKELQPLIGKEVAYRQGKWDRIRRAWLVTIEKGEKRASWRYHRPSDVNFMSWDTKLVTLAVEDSYFGKDPNHVVEWIPLPMQPRWILGAYDEVIAKKEAEAEAVRKAAKEWAKAQEIVFRKNEEVVKALGAGTLDNSFAHGGRIILTIEEALSIINRL